jgi:hypothetical protein
VCADFLTKQYAQVKKTGLKNFDRSKYESEFDAFFDQQFSQTMGSLLKRLEAAVPLDTNLKSKIALAKERRNFLAHHFYRERVEKMFTPMGLDEMIDELEGDQKLFRMVDQELEEVTSSIRKRLGIRDERVEAEFRKMVNELKGAVSK